MDSAIGFAEIVRTALDHCFYYFHFLIVIQIQKWKPFVLFSHPSLPANLIVNFRMLVKLDMRDQKCFPKKIGGNGKQYQSLLEKHFPLVLQ